MKRNRLTVLLAIVLGLALLAGCSNKSATPTPAPSPSPEAPKPAPPAVFHTFSTDNPTSFDPAMVSDVATMTSIIQNVFSGLVNNDKDGKVALDMAADFKVSADGMTYTFTLKDGLKFHSGRAVTSEDFKWSMLRAVNAGLASPVASSYLDDIVGFAKYFAAEAKANQPAADAKAKLTALKDDLKNNKATQADVDAAQKAYDEAAKKAEAEVKAAYAELEKNPGVETPNPKTVVFKIDAPKPYFLAKLTYPTAYVVDKTVAPYDKPISTSPDNVKMAVGTGPFKFTGFVDNSSITLTKSDDYYGQKAKVQTIDIQVIKSEAPRLAKYKAGELDMASVPTADYQSIKADPALGKEMLEWATARTNYFVLNQLVYEPGKNQKVRQAFNYAIDKNALAKVVYQDTVFPAWGVLPPGVPGALGNKVKGLTYDPAKAKATAKEAGYDDNNKLPALKITYRGGDETIQRWVEFLQQQIKANLPIMDVTLEPLEWGVFLKQSATKNVLQSFVLGWSEDYNDPQNFLSLLLACNAPYNRYGYCNKAVDDILAKADVAPPGDARLAMYAQAEQMIVDDGAWVPQHFPKVQYLLKPYVKGFQYNIGGLMPYNTVEIAK